MIMLLRVGAYLVSSLVLWHAFQDSVVMPSIFQNGKHLVLDSEQGMIFGVCAGIGNYTGIDVTCIRIMWVLVSIYRGIGIGLYILAFLLMPLPPT